MNVGTQFTGVTHTGRHIPLGRVIKDDAGNSWRPGTPVVWYDENGKHYERFDLADLDKEFREFSIVVHKEEVSVQ